MTDVVQPEEFCQCQGMRRMKNYTCLARNVAKLRARYPDGFTVDAAVNRNSDAERTAMEGK